MSSLLYLSTIEALSAVHGEGNAKAKDIVPGLE